MPITCVPTDIHRGSADSGRELPQALSTEVWGLTQKHSSIMQLARQIQVPGRGIAIPVVTGNAKADWVGETCNKPVGESTFDIREMRVYKLAVIELFSEEFVRDNNTLYRELVRSLPYSLSTAFDATVLGAQGKPGADFDTLANSPLVDLDEASSTFDGLAQAVATVAAAGGDITAWLASPILRARLLTARNALGEPFFVNAANESYAGSVFGAPVYNEPAEVFPDGVIGVGGDWKEAAFGIVGPITYAESRDAYVNGVSTFQQNMVAVRVEVEVGFIVNDRNKFVRLAGTALGGTAQSGLGGASRMEIAEVDAHIDRADVHVDDETEEPQEPPAGSKAADDGIVAESITPEPAPDTSGPFAVGVPDAVKLDGAKRGRK